MGTNSMNVSPPNTHLLYQYYPKTMSHIHTRFIVLYHYDHRRGALPIELKIKGILSASLIKTIWRFGKWGSRQLQFGLGDRSGP